MIRRLKFLFFIFQFSLCILHAQEFELRLLNHWDNPNGTVERGYAGKSFWKWDLIPTGRNAMPDSLRKRYEEYGRINKSFGINGTVLNNVNAKPEMLTTNMLRKTAKIADVLRPYGIRVYLSVNFASPKALGELKTADPLDAAVRRWWQRKVEEIYRMIPDFGGFLVKANSEGEPGPMDYGRTHVDGANMLAEALKPHKGIVMWRAFVYSAKGGDRANQAYEEFMPFDGQFADNVIIQVKNGPIDFQPREAVSPLFFAMKKTKLMVEFQITQEYTGHSIHTCFLAPMWREFFSVIHDHGVKLAGVAGVANIGDAPNWTANDLAMANWYAFGRLANNSHCSSREIAEDFLKEFYTKDERFVKPVSQMLLKSRETVVDYMMPMGLHHIFAGGHHYGPEPWCAPKGWREDWLPRFYHRADSLGLGFNRTDHHEAGTDGSNNVGQYPEPLRTIYNNVETCPENLLLWFHHVEWNRELGNGLTMWDNLCYHYDRGLAQAKDFVETWKSIRPYIDSERYENQLWRLERQAKDAQWWRDACVLYFQSFSRLPLPADSPAPKYSLKDLMNYHLGIDNYTAPDPADLPEWTGLQVPNFFSDGMVLQRDDSIPVWGKSHPKATVRIVFNKKVFTTKADAAGKWEVLLPKMSAGGPYTMDITANGLSKHIENILIGDVFLCSGQSNMELPIRRCMDAVAADVADYSNSQIRYLKFPHQYNYVKPNDNVRALPWQDITPENCKEVSAVCYFMARELQARHKVPVGIINSAVGGTPVQAWMPQPTLRTFSQYAGEFDKPKYNRVNWVDSVARSEAMAIRDWDLRTTASDTILHKWRSNDYDFSRWTETEMFSDWSKGKNGSYWFHTSVDLPADVSGSKALLRFGAMKDADSIFVNGHFVGNTTYEYPPRNYTVPEGVLRAGRNDIVVHLISQHGRPNFTRGKQYQLEAGGKVFPLPETMRMAIGCTMPHQPASTYFVSGWTGLYNAMIAPLGRMPLKGVLWYQGETNIDLPDNYANLLAAMADSWRQQFGRQLPFVIMQLPAYMGHHDQPFESGWTKIRHQQLLASQLIPNSALVPTLDTGEPNDIHPQDKRPAGWRAAMQMTRLAYGQSAGITTTPVPQSSTIKGGKLLLRFPKSCGTLCLRGDRLSGFSILVGGKYQWAEATLTDAHTVAIDLPAGVTSTTVRYCWDDFPSPTLFNTDSIPAPQFEYKF